MTAYKFSPKDAGKPLKVGSVTVLFRKEWQERSYLYMHPTGCMTEREAEEMACDLKKAAGIARKFDKEYAAFLKGGGT